MANQRDATEWEEETLPSVHCKLEWIFGPIPLVIIKSIVAESNKIYLLTIEYGRRQWQIRKIYEDFLHLHDELVKFDPCESTKTHGDKKECQCLPKFDDQTTDEVKTSEETCEKLVDYLNHIMRRLPCREREVTWEFFQVSCLSFRQEISPSLKEGFLTKRSGTETHSHNIFHRLPIVRDLHQLKQSRKWFVVKDTFITHLHTNLASSRFPTLVDRNFEIIGHSPSSHGHFDIDINNLQRKMRVRCDNQNEFEDWIRAFNQLKNTAVDFLNTSQNRFQSFAPIRSNQFGSWFINGKSYMESVAKALLTAKDEVFISGWWLSPELMMIRPNDDHSMRLDNLLGRIADAGVRVFVMIFKEVSQLNEINSAHTEKILTGKSKLGNIKVIRHSEKSLNNKIFWSHNEKMVIIDQKIAFIGGIDLCFGRWDDEHYRLVDLDVANIADLTHSQRISFSAANDEVSISTTNIDRKSPLFVGKDYLNLIEEKIRDVERFDEDLIDRKRIPRLPWHDEAVVVFGEAARDAARHFIQRWNFHKSDKFVNDDSFSFLIPKTYQDKRTFVVDDWQSFLNEKPFRIDVQCVRSVDSWSAGISVTEASIHQAYLEMIDAAKHFIFIETEFFVSLPNDSSVENSIADALYQRILRAHKSNEKFRVYIVVPLMPAFSKQHAVQESMSYLMRTISKGPNSLFKRLESADVQPTDYIGIFGLRKSDVLLDQLVTEIVYVHSKLMIIDDRMAICGSANLNDRSLLGTRDSEFSLVINDLEEDDGRFNGQTVRVGRFCSSWRRQIFRMMLGIDIIDPVSDEFFTSIRQVAMKNASIYEEIFNCLPTNQVRAFDQMESYSGKPQLRHTDPQKAQERLKEVQGLIVEFPLYFLNDEDMKAGRLTTEGILPTNFWT